MQQDAIVITAIFVSSVWVRDYRRQTEEVVLHSVSHRNVSIFAQGQRPIDGHGGLAILLTSDKNSNARTRRGMVYGEEGGWGVVLPPTSYTDTPSPRDTNLGRGTPHSKTQLRRISQESLPTKPIRARPGIAGCFSSPKGPAVHRLQTSLDQAEGAKQKTAKRRRHKESLMTSEG